MNRKVSLWGLVALGICLVGMMLPNILFAQTTMEDIVAVQKYTRSIHILAMLLLGFGFLMVFVRNYGYSSITATYLSVSIAIPLYFLIKGWGIIGEVYHSNQIDTLLFAEFAAASLLIAIGAPLGRLKMSQYILAALLFIPAYILNEWIVLGGAFGLVNNFMDTAGSITIHAFGAYFGLGMIMRMTTKEEFERGIPSVKTSNQFSLLGSMVLWIFWPSFCSAMVEPSLVSLTAINTIIALCGATIATYLFSVILRNGKVEVADMANAALAGGVAIGATCANITPEYAFVVGIIGGAISVIGYAVIQPALQNMLKGIDTCGVHNLHGMPGIFGGLVAILFVESKGEQVLGIVLTVA
ncbi:MAG: ammonium transporter, partial [Candidatus Desantisbacteria bacterium]